MYGFDKTFTRVELGQNYILNPGSASTYVNILRKEGFLELVNKEHFYKTNVRNIYRCTPIEKIINQLRAEIL